MADGFQSTPDFHAVAIKRRSFSVAELDAMFDANILSRDEKIELIEGEIIEVNSQMMTHGVIKFRLAMKLSALLSPLLEVHVELSVQLNDNTLVDPDISITPKLKLERRYLRRDELLMAIEVSDTTLDFDLGEKARVYAKAGIPEYWVVDINGAQTWVHRQPTETGYESRTSAAFDKKLALLAVEGATIQISELLLQPPTGSPAAPKTPVVQTKPHLARSSTTPHAEAGSVWWGLFV
jgi:Uma2 family endonuclease